MRPLRRRGGRAGREHHHESALPRAIARDYDQDASAARVGVREDCSSRGTADSPTSVEVLHDESAITFRPSVDIGRVACAVVVPEIGPPDIVALAYTYGSRAQPVARQRTQPAASAQQILDPAPAAITLHAPCTEKLQLARSEWVQRVSALHAPCTQKPQPRLMKPAAAADGRSVQ